MIPKSVKIGKFCIIKEGVNIGENTIIGDYVTILEDTQIGSNCYIGSYSILEHCTLFSHVVLQGRNRVGPGSILERCVKMKYNSIVTSHARIGEDAFIGVGAVTLGSDIDGEQISGTHIGDNCYIGGQSMVAPGLKVPAGTILGANSYLREIDGSGTYVGSPAVKK